MATEKPRYSVSVEEDMFREIEDFRYSNRYASRSEATVELIRRGLEALKKEQQAVERPPQDGAVKAEQPGGAAGLDPVYLQGLIAEKAKNGNLSKEDLNAISYLIEVQDEE